MVPVENYSKNYSTRPKEPRHEPAKEHRGSYRSGFRRCETKDEEQRKKAWHCKKAKVYNNK